MVATASRKHRIRTAYPDEAAVISALALRSKAHWGYDPDYLNAQREELTVTGEYIQNAFVNVVEAAGEVAAFYGLSVHAEDTLWLDFLFVEPDAIGAGYGKKLWRHALITAQNFGFQELFLQCDVYSEPFYVRMGATRIAEIKSRLRPGMILPVMRYGF